MAITYDTVASHVRHTLGGELSPDIDLLAVINEAGHYLASMHPWRWLEAAATVGTITSGSTTTLPTDFVELISYTPRGSDSRVTGSKAYMVSPHELEDMRNSSGTLPLNTTYFAVVYTTTSGSSTVAPYAAIDAYANGTVPTVKIRYRKGWTKIDNDGDTFMLPEWMEPLYLQCLRACARGYEEEDVATMSARLGELSQGAQFAAAAQQDSLSESTTLRVMHTHTPS